MPERDANTVPGSPEAMAADVTRRYERAMVADFTARPHYHPEIDRPDIRVMIADAIRAAVAAEREACAVTAVQFPAAPVARADRAYRDGWEDALTALTAAIRGRGHA